MAFAGAPMVRPVRQCQRKLSDTWLTTGAVKRLGARVGGNSIPDTIASASIGQ